GTRMQSSSRIHFPCDGCMESMLSGSECSYCHHLLIRPRLHGLLWRNLPSLLFKDVTSITRSTAKNSQISLGPSHYILFFVVLRSSGCARSNDIQNGFHVYCIRTDLCGNSSHSLVCSNVLHLFYRFSRLQRCIQKDWNIWILVEKSRSNWCQHWSLFRPSIAFQYKYSHLIPPPPQIGYTLFHTYGTVYPFVLRFTNFIALFFQV
ncbi:hypothetical protein PRIPAC_73105, partial [Pristionchus pacificus]